MKLKTLFSLLFPFISFSQVDLIIQPEETPYLLKVNQFQIENSFSFKNISANEKVYVIPSSLIKMGLFKKLELRLQVEQNYVKVESEKINGFLPLIIGFKTKLWKEKGWIPESAIVAQFSMPKWSKKEFQQDRIAHEYILMTQGNYSTAFSVNYNVGIKWDGFSDLAFYTHKTTLNYLITSKTNLYTEYYGQFSTNETAENSINTGIMYPATNDIMLDFSSGYGTSRNAPKFFSTIIVSFRF